MIKLNAIPQDFEPRKKILSKLSAYEELNYLIQMNEFESAFLCGMLKTFRPKKILEVGVAAGGSTAIILQTLEDLGAPYEMHSVDIRQKHHVRKNEDEGFLCKFLIEKNLINPDGLHGTHEFHFGKFLPQIIDSIGGDIDFVILDTVHFMPGEFLDFLAMLPYLTANAVVVLHDVALNYYMRPVWTDAYCTGLLFGAVTADKFLNFNDENFFRYPDIAAFKINEQTVNNVDQIFLALLVNWKYFPNEAELVLYRRHYRRFYPAELCEIFQEAIDMNAYSFHAAQRK